MQHWLSEQTERTFGDRISVLESGGALPTPRGIGKPFPTSSHRPRYWCRGLGWLFHSTSPFAFMFCCCQEMGNLGRKRKGKQHVAKVTPTIRRKQQTIGASSTKMKQHIATRRKVDDWVQNMTKIAADAGILPKKGTAYGEGEASTWKRANGATSCR